MTTSRHISKSIEYTILVAIALLFGALSVVGITWGLPSRNIDKYLFGSDEPWSGEKIYRLSGGAEKFSPQRGADVDVDPLDKRSGEPILLTGSDEGLAKIYLRYRLYTYQPDEMITMMALAGMNPRKLRLDPRLYQYGGLFIYPVGALIGACGATGFIDLRSDVVYYLDHPDEFGKFYIVARAYAAGWGMIGVLVVFAIARRLGGSIAGLLAALLFALMPVAVCMAHEGKPHLPGAVLMLMAVYFAMRHLRIASGSTGQHECGQHSDHTQRYGWLMCVCCGAALGMVLSSAPILILIPLVALLEHRSRILSLRAKRLGTPEAPISIDAPASGTVKILALRTIMGVLLGFAVYFATNPYVLINIFINRDVLASNFGNSLAMYSIARAGEGFIRVLELSVEGATLPVVVLGTLSLILLLIRRGRTPSATAIVTEQLPQSANVSDTKESATVPLSLRFAVLPLALPAVVFFTQFVLIGAGKPAEYGRFGIFTNTALSIGAACLLLRLPARRSKAFSRIAAVGMVAWSAWCAKGYLVNFTVDTTELASRLRVRRAAPTAPNNENDLDSWQEPSIRVAMPADPAPYNCPPLPFGRTKVYLMADIEETRSRCAESADKWVVIRPVDLTQDVIRDRDVDRDFSRWHISRDLPRKASSAVWPSTPISWANKPIELCTAVDMVAP